MLTPLTIAVVPVISVAVTSSAQTFAQRLLVLPKLYVAVTSGITSLTSSPVNVKSSSPSLPIVIDPSEVIVPLA